MRIDASFFLLVCTHYLLELSPPITIEQRTPRAVKHRERPRSSLHWVQPKGVYVTLRADRTLSALYGRLIRECPKNFSCISPCTFVPLPELLSRDRV